MISLARGKLLLINSRTMDRFTIGNYPGNRLLGYRFAWFVSSHRPIPISRIQSHAPLVHSICCHSRNRRYSAYGISGGCDSWPGKSYSSVPRFLAAPSVEHVLVSSEMLTPAGAKKPLRMDSYQWSHGKTKLLIFANTQHVWRYNTRGEYWVLDRESKSLTQIGGDADASSSCSPTRIERTRFARGEIECGTCIR